MVGCLADSGFLAEYDPLSGGLTIDAGGQQEALTDAIVECRIENDQPVGAPTDAYLRDYYPYLASLYVCLVQNELPVPEMITEDTFLARGGEWHPYDLIWLASAGGGPTGTEDLRTANALCPDDY
ncbi:MAG TPA: hypothetical protein ENH15_00475 [Actinobacteria bacterium]|nr:hypothetical protein [Actinomycetota bacterium]